MDANRYRVSLAIKIKSDDKVLDAAALPSGFPILVDTAGMEICEPIMLFLRATQLKAKYPQGFPGSTVGLAHDLRDWLEYLDGLTLPWFDALWAHIENYRNILENSVSPITLKAYAVPTIRRRLYAVVKFYRWAKHMGMYRFDLEPLVLGSQSAQGGQELSLTHRSPRSSLLPQTQNSAGQTIRPISTDNIQAIFAALGPLPPEDDTEPSDLRPVRNRLIAEFSFTTGSRRDEIRSLTRHQIEGLITEIESKSYSADDFVEHYLSRTKGQRGGAILIPVWLVRALHWYIHHERKTAVHASGKKRDPQQLFVNHAHALRNPGAPVTNDTISEMFHHAVMKVGLYTTHRRLYTTTGEEFEFQQGRHRFHDLRHTFALVLYQCEVEQGSSEPWKLVQVLLRHANVQTTISTYLTSLTLYQAKISDALRPHFQGLREYGRRS